MSYVYLKSEPGLWSVGFYTPSGVWQPESDHDTTDKAAERVAWLNGSGTASAPDAEVSSIRAALVEISGELRAVLVQALDSDDRIIIDHVRNAYTIAEQARRTPA